jgi:acetaldehyde dehydrogenase/alcohol dehydrogenase
MMTVTPAGAPGRSPLTVAGAFAADAIASYLEPVTYAAGECIFRERAVAEACFVVDHGEIRLEVESHEVDTDAVLGYMGSPSVLGEVGLLDGLPRSASAFAQTDVAARRLSAEGLERLCREQPDAGTQLVRALGREAAAKLRASTERVAERLLAEQHDEATDRVVAAANAAQEDFGRWSEERVDAVLRDVAAAVAGRAEELARATVAETRMGNVRDKTAKNRFAALAVADSLLGRVGSGPVGRDPSRGVTEIASPVGVVFGLVPLTNPVATFVNKVLICLKARNAVILSVHRGAQGVGVQTGALIRSVLARHGAPEGLVQWLTGRISRQTTLMYMGHPGVGLILATGGPAMVKAAYSAGKPAIGVGSGNAPALVCADADLAAAASAVVASKSFDHGVICGSEQHVVVERSVLEPFSVALELEGAAVLDEDEGAALLQTAFDPETGALLKRYAGRPAVEIAAAAGIERDAGVRLLVFAAPDAELEVGPATRERLAPLLSLFTADDFDAGLGLCRRLLAIEGAGHTAAIHTHSRDRAVEFAVSVPASRILVNSPAAQGCVGMCNGLTPSLILGCGTFGGNSTTDNVGYMNLTNIKRLAEPLEGSTVLR